MDQHNPVIHLCIEGAQAEFADRRAEAFALYQRAWELSEDDYEACIAAHYLARFQATPQETLHWNQIALCHAEADNTARVSSFYPSLYLNMGRSYELLGDEEQARHYYGLAAGLGFPHLAD